MGDADKLMDVESGNKEAHEEELPSDDDEGGKVGFKLTIKRHDFFYSMNKAYHMEAVL